MSETMAEMKARFKQVTQKAYTLEELFAIAHVKDERDRHIYKFDNGFMVAMTRINQDGEEFYRFSFTVKPLDIPHNQRAFDGDGEKASQWALGLVHEFMAEVTTDITHIRSESLGPVFTIDVKTGREDTLALAT